MNNELLKRCRYYHGEEDYPYENEDFFFFWEIEKAWVRNKNMRDVEERLTFSEKCGIDKIFDNVPLTLRAALFSKWCSIRDIQPTEGSFDEFVSGFYSDYMSSISK